MNYSKLDVREIEPATYGGYSDLLTAQVMRRKLYKIKLKL